MRPDEVKSVGVVGAGIMGSGIVEVCAKAGLEVTFVEADESARDRGHQAIERSTAISAKPSTAPRHRVPKSILSRWRSALPCSARARVRS